ncbi:2-oxoglutarate dehydrogenase complex dihydrolipoyllysine-residue succinyltransferase [Magnetospirillum molischianum]|uniref:Dihydrolipoyllysine-residue succinyltransferase component of 2-oxoglutarate dehydrogenase complex n=1 Tax=Magnetospirillum molischianum DSM 120 TaxID=1150626 RepID=H8FW61_MAGML|nr:2-oxoglutarate dehydrogenase complex dihydrolipoyllysine-residue succinyltransferase [Magnetospirillum molischianum]CCG42599.1 Dihydrolipoamide succinyltransferase component of 2-oxoglutarate dehydrogenase complex (E2); acid-inducible [Magnetospirillum molischianum DSM 120]
MSTEIKVPTLGESVTEATVAKWFKAVGETVRADESLVELETDKVTVEVPSPASGVLTEIIVASGATVGVGAVLGLIGEAGTQPIIPASKPVAAPAAATAPAAPAVMPSAKKIAADGGLDPAALAGTGKDGRVTKGDVLSALAAPVPTPAAAPAADLGGREERVKMTRLRKRIAERLKDAQNTAAMLTTFNEVDMTALFDLRNQYKDAFEKKHGTKLGFMSFFVKACVAALKEWPAVNAEIAGDELIYKKYYDIGVAVGTPQGLVVPVVRGADQLSFAGIEQTIAGLGKKARDGKLTMEDLSGGTFTISNGGVYGSLMSTPILNPPQSAILGMHKVQQRPMVMPDGSIAARPMMYLALSYDHRIIDGREAVSFLVRVKDGIEDPSRLLLEV